MSIGPKMSKTDDSLYHGGSLVDEIAALASLAMGVRVRAGVNLGALRSEKISLVVPVHGTIKPKPIVRVRRNKHILPEVIARTR